MSISEEQKREWANGAARWRHDVSFIGGLARAVETLLREVAELQDPDVVDRLALAHQRIEKLRTRLHTIMATATDEADAGLAEAALEADDALVNEQS